MRISKILKCLPLRRGKEMKCGRFKERDSDVSVGVYLMQINIR